MKPFLFLEKPRIEGLSAFSKPLVAGRTIFDLLVISDGFVLVGRFTGFTFTISAERSVGFHGGRSFGFTLATHSRLFRVLLVAVFPYCFALLINCVIFVVVVPIAEASSPINRGLARARPPQKAGFASCQNIIPPPVITQANHFATKGFRLAPAI